MDELLMCSICLDRCTRPKRLICDHAFCAQCLKDLLRRTDSLRCPECRRETQTPTRRPADVDNLPNDLTLSRFLELRNSQGQGQGQSPSRNQQHSSNKCFLCESIFTNNCPHCSKNLCQKCGIQHLKSEVEEKVTKMDSFVQHKNEVDVRLHLWSNMKMSVLAAREKAVINLNGHFDKILNSMDTFLNKDDIIPDMDEAQCAWQRGQLVLAKTNASFLELHITMNQCGPTVEAIEKLEKSMDKLYEELLAFQWLMNKSTGELRQRLDKELGTEKKIVETVQQPPQLRLAPTYTFYEESSRIYVEGKNDDVVMANEMVADVRTKRFNNICRLEGGLIPGEESSQEETRWNDYRNRQIRPWVAIPARRENARTDSTQSTNSGNQQTPNSTDAPKAALVRTALHQKSGLFNTPVLQFLPEENPFLHRKNLNVEIPSMKKDENHLSNRNPSDKTATIEPDHVLKLKEVTRHHPETLTQVVVTSTHDFANRPPVHATARPIDHNDNHVVCGITQEKTTEKKLPGGHENRSVTDNLALVQVRDEKPTAVLTNQDVSKTLSVEPTVNESKTKSTVQPSDLSKLLQVVDSFSHCTTEAQRSAFMEKVWKAVEKVTEAEKMAMHLMTNPLQEQHSYEEIRWGYYNVRRQREMLTRLQKLAQDRGINSTDDAPTKSCTVVPEGPKTIAALDSGACLDFKRSESTIEYYFTDAEFV